MKISGWLSYAFFCANLLLEEDICGFKSPHVGAQITAVRMEKESVKMSLRCHFGN